MRGYLEPDDDPDLGRIALWSAEATCEAPQVEVEVEVRRQVCPGTARGSVAAEVWWPRP